VDNNGGSEPFKTASSRGGGIGVVETDISHTPEKPAYWYRGFDGVERGCTPGMHRALHTTCRAVDHTWFDESGRGHTRKVVRVHHNPWSKHYAKDHQHKCLIDDNLNKCVCCDSFVLHTEAPTPAPGAVEPASPQCRFKGWHTVEASKIISDHAWGGIQKGIRFYDQSHTVCSTTPDDDSATYFKQRVKGAFEFSFTYDNGDDAVGGVNRFMAGFWVTTDPSAFQASYPEDNADGPRYFFSPVDNAAYYHKSPGKELERKFAKSLFKPGARITLARHRNCDIVLYQNEHKMWTYKNANCGDGYIWLGHYKGSQKKSCLSHVTLCEAPKLKAPEPKGPRCHVIRNRGKPKQGKDLLWTGDLQGVKWDANKGKACGGNTNAAIRLQQHVYGNFEFGFTYDGLWDSTDLISRFFGGFWQTHDDNKDAFTPSDPTNGGTANNGPRYYWEPVNNELMFSGQVEHQFPKGDYQGYKGEMSLVPGYKKPRAKVMLVRYNGRMSLFKNGWRMYEWSEENHEDGFLWLGHHADSKGTFCIEDVYVCN